MFTLTLPVILGLVGVAFAAIRLGLWWFGWKKTASIQEFYTAFNAAAKALAGVLTRRYRQIDEEKPPEDPAQGINDAWDKKP